MLSIVSLDQPCTGIPIVSTQILRDGLPIKSQCGRISSKIESRDGSVIAFSLFSKESKLWGLPEHFKTKELGYKLRSSLGEVMEDDIFSVKGKENSIVKIDDSVKGKVHEEKWGDWLRSDQGGRRETLLKENINPNTTSTDSSQQLIGRKPIPVNLLKDLAGLSVHTGGNANREEKEVTSEHIPCNPPPKKPNATSLALKDSSTLGEKVGQGLNNSQFTFHATESCSQSSTKKMSLKQRARKKFISITGVKRNALETREVKDQKRRCSDIATNTEEGEGATRGWAPNAQ
ncbi:hypothetical protein PIB30_096901 [Stylosanthes scabra]|uniref:Uncharacterized protein n=1 Tax=Stylosanthes scabra TaxID=79078 RepID=A0ABU6QWT2_9FABA|nr:hypothetical protein [Stylosanthes scabra]